MKGLLVDFGGVLTSDVFASFEAFCHAEGLPPDAVRDRFAGDPGSRGLLEALELGRLTPAEFEPRFATVLGVAPDGLIDRLFGGLAPDVAMLRAVRAARAGGIRTGLLSNSWDLEHYDRDGLRDAFDVVVISGEVGLRKPDPAIYALAAQRLGLAPQDITFVDDLRGNLKPARALGMTTLHHVRAQDTIRELSRALGVELG